MTYSKRAARASSCAIRSTQFVQLYCTGTPPSSRLYTCRSFGTGFLRTPHGTCVATTHPDMGGTLLYGECGVSTDEMCSLPWIGHGCTGQAAQESLVVRRAANEEEQENHAHCENERVDTLPQAGVSAVACLCRFPRTAAFALSLIAAHRTAALAICRRTCTIRTAMSAGVTPAIRAACPIVRGWNCPSFWRASTRRESS